MIDNMLNFVMTPTGYATFTILAIKSTAIIVVGLLLWLALRGAAASARHMVLGATLVAMMLLPAISLLAPPLHLTITNQHTQGNMLPAVNSPIAETVINAAATTTEISAIPALAGDFLSWSSVNYFLFAYLIKTPPGILLIVAASLLALYMGQRLTVKTELFIYLPVALLIAITCLWKVNIGLRHLLPL